jgi:hypothetical protein
VLAWNLLTRGEDYAFKRPSLMRRKLRRLELTAGAPPAKTGPKREATHWGNPADRAERELVEPGRGHLSPARCRLAVHWAEAGRGRDTGARISKVFRKTKQRGRPLAPKPALELVGHPRPTEILAQPALQRHPKFDFHP